MSFLTRSELLGYSARSAQQSFSAIRESQSRKEAPLKQAGRISSLFLSHSHQDKDLVVPAVAFLKSLGVDVYVDWLDGEMPPKVSGETAKKLKTKIKEHDKFIVLVTENSKDSHWVPWELGVADGEKRIAKIATFPIRNDTRDFVGNEYFSIYPRVEAYKDDWIVWIADPPNLRYLKEWLATL